MWAPRNDYNPVVFLERPLQKQSREDLTEIFGVIRFLHCTNLLNHQESERTWSVNPTSSCAGPQGRPCFLHLPPRQWAVGPPGTPLSCRCAVGTHPDSHERTVIAESCRKAEAGRCSGVQGGAPQAKWMEFSLGGPWVHGPRWLAGMSEQMFWSRTEKRTSHQLPSNSQSPFSHPHEYVDLEGGSEPGGVQGGTECGQYEGQGQAGLPAFLMGPQALPSPPPPRCRKKRDPPSFSWAPPPPFSPGRLCTWLGWKPSPPCTAWELG